MSPSRRRGAVVMLRERLELSERRACRIAGQLLEACEESNVALEAYSPLGTGRHLSDERVGQIAERLGRTPVQVLLRWCVQRNLVVITKSTHRDRIEENAQIFDFTLSDEEMGAGRA